MTSKPKFAIKVCFIHLTAQSLNINSVMKIKDVMIKHMPELSPL